MVVAYPWSGRDWNRAIAISGRAAMPGLPGGSGFNFRSVQATTGFMRPGLRGLGRMRRLIGLRQRRGFRGLGQDPSVDLSAPYFTGGVSNQGLTVTDPNTGLQVPAADVGTGYPTVTSGSAATNQLATVSAQGGSSASGTGAPWYASLLQSAVNTGSTIASYELNPLYQKSTYIQTPSGQIIATNQATTGIPGLTTSSSFMPLLLLGGGAVVLMMMMGRR